MNRPAEVETELTQCTVKAACWVLETRGGSTADTTPSKDRWGRFRKASKQHLCDTYCTLDFGVMPCFVTGAAYSALVEHNASVSSLSTQNVRFQILIAFTRPRATMECVLVMHLLVKGQLCAKVS